jgi:hypothetical protein
MESNSHSFLEPFIISVSNNGDLKSEPNYSMKLLSNELINKTNLETEGQGYDEF